MCAFPLLPGAALHARVHLCLHFIVLSCALSLRLPRPSACGALLAVDTLPALLRRSARLASVAAHC